MNIHFSWRYSFPIEWPFHLCWSPVDHRCISSLLGSHFLFHLFKCLSLLPVPHCCDYCNFVVNLDIKNCESSNLVLIFQDCFGYSGFHWSFIWILRPTFPFLQKEPLDLNRDCILSVYLFGEHCSLNNIKSYNLWIQYIFLFV